MKNAADEGIESEAPFDDANCTNTSTYSSDESFLGSDSLSTNSSSTESSPRILTYSDVRPKQSNPFWDDYFDTVRRSQDAVGRSLSDDEEEAPRGRRYFYPALSTQRYERIIEELTRHENIIDKLVDFGCNECKFLVRVRNRLHRIESLIGVDIDEDILKRSADLLKPDKEDIKFKLDFPLRIKLFGGSIAQYDRRLEDVDAVVAIELFEHLDIRTLHQFPHVVFGQMQPYVVILSTPNVEYNVVFEMGERKFRHPDHKFELTREQFEEWCLSVVHTYKNYWVKFIGVGNPPMDKKSIGHCTQIAVFRMIRTKYLEMRKIKRIKRQLERDQFSDVGYDSEENDQKTDLYFLQPYKLISDIKFPHKTSEAREIRMDLDLKNFCNHLMSFRHLELVQLDDKKGIWFTIHDVFQCPNIKRYLKTEDDLAIFLVDQGWLVDCRENKVFYEHERIYAASADDSNDDDEYFQGKHEEAAVSTSTAEENELSAGSCS